MDLRGRSAYDRNYRHKKYEFENYFEDTLTRATVLLNGLTEIVISIVDHSQANNKDLSDDKYIHALNETPINVGDYIDWSDQHWMIFTKEYKTINTHQQAKMKEANESIKWIRNGEIVNDGNGWWAYVQSNTLYTMGISENNLIDVGDSKMMMYMQNNADTIDLRINERIFIGDKVYKIKFPDRVSRQGLISFLLDEDTVSEEHDNVELGVTDYYKYFGTTSDPRDELEDDPEIIENNLMITGPLTPRIGAYSTYKADFEVVEWTVDTMESDDIVVIKDKNSSSLTIQAVQDVQYKNIGRSFNITAKDVYDNYTTLHLTVGKKY